MIKLKTIRVSIYLVAKNAGKIYEFERFCLACHYCVNIGSGWFKQLIYNEKKSIL